MPSAAVVPDGEVVFAPLEPHLGIVVLGDEVEEIGQQNIRLVLGDAIDALGEALVDVEGFPSSDGLEVLVVSSDSVFKGLRRQDTYGSSE